MVIKFYVMQIELKKMTIKEVPQRWREGVANIVGVGKNDKQENYIEVGKED